MILFVLLFLCGCTETKKEETGKNYYCNYGELDGNKCKVVLSVEPDEVICEDDNFTFNEESRKCENVISIPANRRIGCKDEENYTLRDGACHPNDGKGGVKYRVNLYTCPDSATLNGNQCEFVDESEPKIKCQSGYEVNKKFAKCDIIIYEDALVG